MALIQEFICCLFLFFLYTCHIFIREYGKGVLNHAIIELTSDCNLRCKHCYNWWKQEGINMEKIGVFFRKAYLLLDYLIRKTTLSKVVFTGGNQLLANDL